MFQFPGFALTIVSDGPSTRRVPPFGYARIISCLQIPGAFRSLPRPSSPPDSLGILRSLFFPFLSLPCLFPNLCPVRPDSLLTTRRLLRRYSDHTGGPWKKSRANACATLSLSASIMNLCESQVFYDSCALAFEIAVRNPRRINFVRSSYRLLFLLSLPILDLFSQ